MAIIALLLVSILVINDRKSGNRERRLNKKEPFTFTFQEQNIPPVPQKTTYADTLKAKDYAH